ncbi:unnamed protein product [Ambrosiozyma monospora]|uniref:Unnamed protein product n=1 Tax=Ambrosiozyma monospora TaxID=43982 RepID=A0ACB5T4A0_AMBMO|nr:unnamed protein product [Ambrosiozyma monospora]
MKRDTDISDIFQITATFSPYVNRSLILCSLSIEPRNGETAMNFDYDSFHEFLDEIFEIGPEVLRAIKDVLYKTHSESLGMLANIARRIDASLEESFCFIFKQFAYVSPQLINFKLDPEYKKWRKVRPQKFQDQYITPFSTVPMIIIMKINLTPLWTQQINVQREPLNATGR